MSGFSEASTIQAAVIARLTETRLGWSFAHGENLLRTTGDVFIEPDLVEALIRLNSVIAEKPERVNEVVPQLRALLLSVADEGLVESNERMVEWLQGRRTYRFIGTNDYVPIRLIDFDDLTNNKFVVSDEVTFVGVDTRRYDIVLWVNGIPLVVGETKTPVSMQVSWLDAARDIEVYESRTPAFFVPNVFSFGTDGREFHYGAVGQAPEKWLVWGHTGDPLHMGPMERVLRSVDLMLSAQSVLDILRDFTLYTTETVGGQTTRVKVIPRYPQVEGVAAILKRAKDPHRRRGLLWQHQGSGKTYLMAFAAGKLLRDPDLDGPTVLVVLDRLDLIEQVTSEFTSAGIPRVRVAETKDELQRLLADDARGVIITTIFRFGGAGLLNARSNVIVLVDEAHRTQEGRLGAEMREALPNAQLFGLTGTPVTDADRNTFEAFGDPADPGYVLNHYSMERSIADGATLPVHVETRLVDFHLDDGALDEAFAALADEEGLTDEQRDVLIRRAGSVETILKNPERVRAVCQDIVDHWYERMAPLGLKAQVVAYDRELCVLYGQELREILAERAAEEGDPTVPEVEVVMTVGTTKSEPEEWSRYRLTREQEATLKARFRDVHDPLSFLVVTAKLLTGFDAPIEGVMYLDRPLKAHTLFQAVTRTNRRWTNPVTGQEKRFGLVVDYVGIGEEIAKALRAAAPEGGKQTPVDFEDLIDELKAAVAEATRHFEGIDRTDSGFVTLLEAQSRLATEEAKEAFAVDFLRAEALWEFCWYHPDLKPIEADYRWLAKVYGSIQPATASNSLLWHRLGQKTLEIVHSNITDVRIEDAALAEVVVDEEIISVIKDLKLPGLDVAVEGKDVPVTAKEVIDSIEERLRRKLDGGGPSKVWESLAARLEEIRRMRISKAEDSVDLLKAILDLARQVLAAEKAEEEGRLEDIESILPDPHVGALTQIFYEYAPEATPEIVERVVERIDSIVADIRGTGWQTSHPADRQVRQEIRKALADFGLPPAGDLFNRAYAYVAENY